MTKCGGSVLLTYNEKVKKKKELWFSIGVLKNTLQADRVFFFFLF